MKKIEMAIGLMSGTSADGINASIIKIKREGGGKMVSLIHHNLYPFSKKLRETILNVSKSGGGTSEEICRLNFTLGEKFAEAAIKIAREGKVDLKEIALIGSHGQTISHLIDRKKAIATLQIGEPSIIAEMTGVTVVADFRPRDIAAGGEGAPLTPYPHLLLFGGLGKSVVVNNLGGVSNLTYLPKNGPSNDIIAFDTGPANMLIDSLVSIITNKKKSYDKNGIIAARGKVNEQLLSRLLKHPFFRKAPPKSTGREMFGHILALEILHGLWRRMDENDIIATATALTARSIANSYKRFIKGNIDEAIFCGGGSRNKTMMSMLKEALYPIEVKTSADYGIPSEAVESISFALLGAATLSGIPSNIPSATGAKRSVVLGKVVAGRKRGDYFSLLKISSALAGSAPP